jgi:hypothetical protein
MEWKMSKSNIKIILPSSVKFTQILGKICNWRVHFNRCSTQFIEKVYVVAEIGMGLHGWSSEISDP